MAIYLVVALHESADDVPAAIAGAASVPVGAVMVWVRSFIIAAVSVVVVALAIAAPPLVRRCIDVFLIIAAVAFVIRFTVFVEEE